MADVPLSFLGAVGDGPGRVFMDAPGSRGLCPQSVSMTRLAVHLCNSSLDLFSAGQRVGQPSLPKQGNFPNVSSTVKPDL